MRRAARIGAALAAALLLAPAGGLAGPLTGRAGEQVMAFAGHAGYIAGTIPFCGGDAAEIRYFKTLVRDMLTGIGAGEDDWSAVSTEIDRVAPTVTARAQDCSDEGGLMLADELRRRFNALRDAVGE